MRAVTFLCLVLLITTAAPLAAAEPRVEFEIVMPPSFVATDSQKWLELFKTLDLADIRMRAGTAREAPEVKFDAGTYRVIGVLTGQNTLRLPAGSFSLSDKPSLVKWVAKLKSGGEEGLTTKEVAFGLLPKELVAVQESLAGPISFTTKGEKTADVVTKIARQVKLEIKIDAKAAAALAGEGAVADELAGLSAGTALAAAVRPLGLVLVPGKQGGTLQLLVTDVRSSPASWPVGWPAEKSPRETLPALFNFLEVEIKETPLIEALDAVQTRLKVPFVIDYNSLAREQVDLAKVKVTLPPGKTYYSKILDRTLFAAKLKAELRVDDGARPFMWITTLKK